MLKLVMCLVVTNTPGVSWWCPGHPETKSAAEFAQAPPGGYGKTAKDKLAKKDQCFLSETAPSHHPLLDAALKIAYKRKQQRIREKWTNTDWHIHNVKRIAHLKKRKETSVIIHNHWKWVSLVSRFEKQTKCTSDAVNRIFH